MKLLDFIKVYDGVLAPELCEGLISLFEQSEHKKVVNHDAKPFFTELNLSEHHLDCHKLITNYIVDVMNRYVKDLVDYTDYFPNQPTILEGIRIKRYNAGTGERFDNHVDVSNPSSAMRYLSFLFYLSDNFSGGETHFLPEYKVTPITGSVLVFPPTWQYPHAGLEVKSGTKYIMSSYLHYYDPVK